MFAIATKVTVSNEFTRLEQKTERMNVRSLNKSGAYVRTTASRSIRVRQKPSLPGQPPHTRGKQGRKLRTAIRYDMNRTSMTVVIGPTRTTIALIGHTHEFGGTEPEVKPKSRRSGWDLRIGGYGPLDSRNSKGKFQKRRWIKIRTDRQLAAVKRTIANMSAKERFSMTKGKPRRKYPPRPFMKPALDKSVNRIPENWRAALH